MQYLEFRSMSCDILLAAEGTASQVERGLNETRAYIEQQAEHFTRFRETSELAAVNRAAGEWQRVSEEMYALVAEAYTLYQETGGLFDPSILDALEDAGYDRSIELLGAGSFMPRARNRRAAGSCLHIEFDRGARAIRLPKGVRLDLGGIAKGWIAEQAALRLSRYTDACAVSAGGDLFAVGLPAHGQWWEIGLEDPLMPDRDLATLYTGPGAVATSSVVKRRWLQEGKIRHHLIDPRTSSPAETPWLSLTVLAPHAATAEAFAKALLIAGPANAATVAAVKPEIAYLAVDAQGCLSGSPNAGHYLLN